jgi:hypothetical protein
VNPHAPDAHRALAFMGGVHTPVQPPQWFASVIVSTHDVPHNMSDPEHAALHAYVPPIALHTGVEPLHDVEHDPQ